VLIGCTSNLRPAISSRRLAPWSHQAVTRGRSQGAASRQVTHTHRFAQHCARLLSLRERVCVGRIGVISRPFWFSPRATLFGHHPYPHLLRARNRGEAWPVAECSLKCLNECIARNTQHVFIIFTPFPRRHRRFARDDLCLVSTGSKRFHFRVRRHPSTTTHLLTSPLSPPSFALADHRSCASTAMATLPAHVWSWRWDPSSRPLLRSWRAQRP